MNINTAWSCVLLDKVNKDDITITATTNGTHNVTLDLTLLTKSM